METIIIILLLLIVILLLSIILIKLFSNKEKNRLLEINNNTIKEIAAFKYDIVRDINQDIEILSTKVDERLILISNSLQERLDESLSKSNKTFNDVIERLSKIDEAQKKIDVLGSDIVSLQTILTDKKTRGIYGEVTLYNIMSNIFGENNDTIYKMQYLYPNQTIVDCALFAPSPLGTISIDSKFPLENYRIMIDKTKDKMDRIDATKAFKIDVKRHIDAISSKYIIHGVTSDQAIMFLPAEAIFAEINAYHTDLIDYAYRKKVWIASPTTLISTLTTVQMILKNMEKDKYTSIIHEEINKLAIEFNRYKDRWDKLSRSIETVSKDCQNVHLTTEKISRKFEQINLVQFDDKIEKL